NSIKSRNSSAKMLRGIWLAAGFSISVLAILPSICYAQVSTAELTKRVAAAKALPPTVGISLTRDRDVIIVTASRYPTNDLRTQKVDGLLIGRAITHADPGTVSCVVVRFLNAMGSGYTDVLVSNR